MKTTVVVYLGISPFEVDKMYIDDYDHLGLLTYYNLAKAESDANQAVIQKIKQT